MAHLDPPITSGPVDAAAPAWDDFVATHPCGHLLQSSAWARLRAEGGWRARLAVVAPPQPKGEREGHAGLPAGALVLLRSTPVGEFGYVPRGPVTTAGDPRLGAVLDAVRKESGGAFAVRYEPGWLEWGGREGDPCRADGSALQAEGLQRAADVQPRSSVRVCLAATEDELLAGMKQKWRYNVRLAARRGVRTRVGREGDLELFGRLVAETAERDGFLARPPTYYAAAWRLCPGARLLVAEDDEGPLGAVMTFRHGDTATYLYGASASVRRRLMPNHLLQWEAMRLARADGCLWYDMWGIPDQVGAGAARGLDPDEVEASDDPLWGVWRFKRGFGGEVTRTVGAWDDVRRPARYALAMRVGPWLQRLLGRR